MAGALGIQHPDTCPDCTWSSSRCTVVCSSVAATKCLFRLACTAARAAPCACAEHLTRRPWNAHA